MAKGSSTQTPFEVAIMLRELQATKDKVKPTKDEWISEMNLKGIRVSEELIRSALELSSTEDRSVFTTDSDRVRRLSESILRLEQRVSGLEEKLSQYGHLKDSSSAT